MVAVIRRRYLVTVEPWTGFGPASSGVCVMLWSVARHAQLVEAHQLQDEAAVAEWLTGIVLRYGREHVAVDWTDGLRRRKRLALLVAKCLDVTVPRTA